MTQHERILFEISGSLHGVDELFALLGCYTPYVSTCLTKFWDSLWICSILEDGTDRLFRNVDKTTPKVHCETPKSKEVKVHDFICVHLLAFFRIRCWKWRGVESSKDICPEAIVTMTPFYWPCWGAGQVNGSPESQMQSSGYLLQSRCSCCWWRSRTEQCQSAGSRNPTSNSGQESPALAPFFGWQGDSIRIERTG